MQQAVHGFNLEKRHKMILPEYIKVYVANTWSKKTKSLFSNARGRIFSKGP